MPGYLKQATAAQSRALGPFVSDTDFKTVQTGLTIANTDIKLVVNGGVSANKNSGGGTHRVNGVYGVTFDATDTATVGEMEVSVSVAGALVVFDKFFVLEEAVYAALFEAAAPGYLQPTTAGRTLDVSAGGEAGVDWANVGSPTTALALTGTTIATTQKVDIETIKTNPVVNAGTVTFPTNATLASTTNITGGTITTVTTTTTATNVTTVNGLAANVITAASIAADAGTEIAAAVWDRDATLSQTQGTFGQAIGDPVADTNTIYKAVVTDAAGATVGVDVVAVKAETASIQVDTNDLQTQVGVAGAGLTAINLPDQTMNITGDITGNLSGSVGSVTGAVGSVTAGVTVTTNNDKTGYALTAGERTSIATAIGTRQITESYRANGAAPTLDQALSETLAHLGESAIASTTKTINKFDHVTAAETFTLDSATAPTSITRAT